MSLPALLLQQLRFRWPGAGSDLLAIDALRLELGEQAVLLGPSGSGKSTLLGIVAGLQSPSSGRVEVLGTDLAGLGGAARDRFRADHMGFVFQQFNLLPYLSALDNVLLPLRFSALRRRRAGDARAQARRLLGELQLPEASWALLPHRLSVGQQQRVAVARALIGGPELVVADEPSSALDSDTRDQFLALLQGELARHGSSLLMVTHDRAVAERFGRVIRLAATASAQEPAPCGP